MALTSLAALPSGSKALPPIRPEAEYELPAAPAQIQARQLPLATRLLHLVHTTK